MMTRANQLEDVYRTISVEPLEKSGEVGAFYSETIDNVRGGGVHIAMALRLGRSHMGEWFKASLTGHPGGGKTTELRRLVQEARIASQYESIFFSAVTDLNANAFETADVLEVMLIALLEKAQVPASQGGAGIMFAEDLLREIDAWFATYTLEETRTASRENSMEGSIGIKEIPLLNRVVNVLGSWKGMIKNASSRSEKMVLQRQQKLPDLVALVNKTLRVCNQFLQVKQQKQWLLVGDDFEKDGVSRERLKQFFCTDGVHLKDLEAHIIFTLPVWLVYSSDQKALPFSEQNRFVLPDVPVFQPDHTPHVQGRAELSLLLEKRVARGLFEPSAWKRLIVASGGNLRDLFFLVADAADEALIKKETVVNDERANRAVLKLLSNYFRGLTVTKEEYAEKITGQTKAACLKSIYDNASKRELADPITLSLLYSRAVQEFNGDVWYGVHPVVVDILQDQGNLERSRRGGTRDLETD
jgi:hypothetical protein